jgi:multiple antibiotic resistance protein
MNLQFDIIEILKVTMVLFAVIDVIGSIPIIISLKQKTGGINASKASVVSFGIMIVFLFVGQTILDIIGISIGDFAIAGSILLFIVAFEMILGVQIAKDADACYGLHYPISISFNCRYRNFNHTFIN